VNNPALQIKNLSKRFGHFPVTRDVSFALPVGARFALIGPNGAGKTSLINLISGRLKADSGSVLLHGVDVTGLNMIARVRSGLARTFQINSLFPRLTPLESVLMAIYERDGIARNMWWPISSRSDAIDEACRLLQQLQLLHVATKATHTLAYGQQRLLEIALAMATRPKVLLLDEPAAGVPKNESREFFKVIAALPPDVTILFIEHDMDVVFNFASRVLVLVAGSLLIEAEPEVIRRDDRVREVYLGKAHYG
jgi:branched-chain amino acid transport system ATP-binding protein